MLRCVTTLHSKSLKQHSLNTKLAGLILNGQRTRYSSGKLANYTLYFVTCRQGGRQGLQYQLTPLCFLSYWRFLLRKWTFSALFVLYRTNMWHLRLPPCSSFNATEVSVFRKLQVQLYSCKGRCGYNVIPITC